MFKVSTETIEVGDWQSGTHCVPLHVRTLKEKPFEHKPPGCPRTDLDDHKTMSSEEEKWHYDSGKDHNPFTDKGSCLVSKMSILKSR